MQENRDFSLLLARITLNLLMAIFLLIVIADSAINEQIVIALLIAQSYALLSYDENDYRFLGYSTLFLLAIYFNIFCAVFVTISLIYTRHFKKTTLLALAVTLYYLIVSQFAPVALVGVLLFLVGVTFNFLASRYQYYHFAYEKQRDQAHETTYLYRNREDQIKQLIDSKSQASVLQERNRIASELHDHIGHTISSAIVQAEAYKARFLTIDQVDRIELNDRQQAIDGMIKTLKDGMRDIRTSLHHLRDQSLDLGQALEAMRAKYPGLTLSFYLHQSEQMSYDMKAKLLRVVAEIIANAVNHSDATHLKISIVRQRDFYSLMARDNGSQPVGDLKVGMGLDNMQAIARQFSGSFNYGYQNGFYIHMTLYERGLK